MVMNQNMISGIPKRRKKTKRISSFVYIYLLAWKEAVKREVRLDTEDSSGRKRVYLRQRMNMVRRRFAEQYPDEGDFLFKAEAVLDRNDKAVLILRPVAGDLEMFKRAGIQADYPEEKSTKGVEQTISEKMLEEKMEEIMRSEKSFDQKMERILRSEESLDDKIDRIMSG